MTAHPTICSRSGRNYTHWVAQTRRNFCASVHARNNWRGGVRGLRVATTRQSARSSFLALEAIAGSIRSFTAFANANHAILISAL